MSEMVRGENIDALSRLEIFRYSDVHLSVLRSDVRCCAPLPWLGEGKLLVLSFVP